MSFSIFIYLVNFNFSQMGDSVVDTIISIVETIVGFFTSLLGFSAAEERAFFKDYPVFYQSRPRRSAASDTIADGISSVISELAGQALDAVEEMYF